MRKKSFYLILGIPVLLSFFLLKEKTGAEFNYFYPHNCLGSFINPEKTQGGPEVENQDLINEANSAVYLGGFKEIYCGNFQGPIEEGEIQSITLKFNMILTNERRETPVIQSTSSESLIEKIIPPKTIEIINASTENSPTTIPENPPTSTIEIPQSFFYKMVFAEETKNQESTSSNESVTNEQTFVTSTTEEIINTTTQETVTTTQELSTTTPISTTTPEEITSTTQPEQTLNYFDVFYTLDGQTWQYLGSITNENLQDISFSIPANDWLMISKIQIKVQSNPTIENIPYLYLESMSLEVGFTKEKVAEETIATSTDISTTSALLKERKINRETKIKNQEKIYCKIEPFSISLNENETKQAIIILNSQNLRNLEVGNLPQGIDITFAENNDYQIQTNSGELTLNITRMTGSVKGNFTLPIIFDSDEATTICQVNIIAN